MSMHLTFIALAVLAMKVSFIGEDGVLLEWDLNDVPSNVPKSEYLKGFPCPLDESIHPSIEVFPSGKVPKKEDCTDVCEAQEKIVLIKRF